MMGYIFGVIVMAFIGFVVYLASNMDDRYMRHLKDLDDLWDDVIAKSPDVSKWKPQPSTVYVIKLEYQAVKCVTLNKIKNALGDPEKAKIITDLLPVLPNVVGTPDRNTHGIAVRYNGRESVIVVHSGEQVVEIVYVEQANVWAAVNDYQCSLLDNIRKVWEQQQEHVDVVTSIIEATMAKDEDKLYNIYSDGLSTLEHGGNYATPILYKQTRDGLDSSFTMFLYGAQYLIYSTLDSISIYKDHAPITAKEFEDSLKGVIYNVQA